jgi:hypothetical protein
LVLPTLSGSNSKKLLEQTRDVLRMKHYSLHTKEAYVGWPED